MAAIRNKHGLTSKQEAYCLAYINSGNATASYQIAYDCSNSTVKTAGESAARLHKNPMIVARIEALRAPVVAKALAKYSHTLNGILEELEETRGVALAAATPQTSAAVAASMGKAKLLGLITDKVAVDVDMSISSLIRELEVTDAVDNLPNPDM